MVETVEKIGFKLTEVGLIPEDWEVKIFENFSNKIGSGKTPTGGNRVYKKEGRPFVRSQNVGWGTLYLDDIVYIDEAIHSTFPSTEIIEEDVLLNITGASIGRSAVSNTKIIGGNVNQHVCIIRVDKTTINSSFINYFLLSNLGQKQINDFQAGGNRQGLNFTQIKSLQIPLPPTKAEQTAIASALNDADTLISQIDKLIAKKKAIKQGAMQELLKPKEGWEVKKLGEICEIDTDNLNSNTSPDYEFKYISLEDVDCGFLRNITELRFKNAPSRARRKLKKGDVLISTVRPNLMSHLLVNEEVSDWICSTGFSVLRCKRDILYPEYIFFHFFSSGINNQIESIISGSNYPAINSKDVKSLLVPLPNIKEQVQIAQILSDMDAEITVLGQKLEKCQQIKQGMMQVLLTGKVRLVEKKEEQQIIPAIATTEKNHNWQINEAVIIGFLSAKFGTLQFPMYRKRYTKLAYLLHRYKEKVAEGYLKKAAGPYNPKTKYNGPEKIALENKYVQEHSNGSYTGFISGTNATQAEDYFLKWYGQDSLDWLIQFQFEKMDELELLSTVDMAMVELKETKEIVSLADIKALIKSDKEWKAKLERSIFSDINIQRAINRLKILF